MAPQARNFGMVKRTNHQASNCPIARPLDAIGDWWSLLIVRDAMDGKRRFGEFQKSLGLAKNILAARLRSLAAHGIIVAQPATDGSTYQDYVLTEKGRDLFPVLIALRQWGERHFFGPGEPAPELPDRFMHQPVEPLIPRTQDGRILRPEDAMLRRK
jgi:DNA-binding HxlR family transcriptional regulator